MLHASYHFSLYVLCLSHHGPRTHSCHASGFSMFRVNMAQGLLPFQAPSILLIPRITGNSSLHRLARVQQLPTPSTAKDALKILGDQEDHAWPGSSWRFWRRILGCFEGDSFGSRKQSRNYLNVLRFIQESLAISKQKATYDYIQYFRRV